MPNNSDGHKKNFHRYPRKNDPEFSLDSLLQKQSHVNQYRNQLDRQVAEKRDKKLDLLLLARLEDRLLDFKVTKQRQSLRQEFEDDHRVGNAFPSALRAKSKSTVNIASISRNNGEWNEANSWTIGTSSSFIHHRSKAQILHSGEITTNSQTPVMSANSSSCSSGSWNRTIGLPGIGGQTPPPLGTHAPSHNVSTQTDPSLMLILLKELLRSRVDKGQLSPQTESKRTPTISRSMSKSCSQLNKLSSRYRK